MKRGVLKALTLQISYLDDIFLTAWKHGEPNGGRSKISHPVKESLYTDTIQ